MAGRQKQSLGSVGLQSIFRWLRMHLRLAIGIRGCTWVSQPDKPVALLYDQPFSQLIIIGNGNHNCHLNLNAPTVLTFVKKKHVKIWSDCNNSPHGPIDLRLKAFR